jgi:ribose-phosphate pyrophosphokinase
MEEQPVLILADFKGRAWDFAQRVYQKLNSRPERNRKYRLGQVEIIRFNDGELFLKILENVRGKNCYFIHDSSMMPQDWTVSLGLVNDALMRASAGEINNVLPYMKYGRQDRISDPRTPISSSFLAKIINNSANRVLTTDLHNPASAGSYTIPFDNLKAYPVLINHLKKNHSDFLQNAVIVAPDVGSAKRAESYAKRLGLDVAIAHKKREEAGVVRGMTIIGDVEDKNAIIVDDMIDTGGTLCKAADVLKEKGALKIYACATHGVFSKNAIEKLQNSSFEKIIITDSIPLNADGKIEVVSVADLFAESIYRISHGESISALFLQ